MNHWKLGKTATEPGCRAFLTHQSVSDPDQNTKPNGRPVADISQDSEFSFVVPSVLTSQIFFWLHFRPGQKFSKRTLTLVAFNKKTPAFEDAKLAVYSFATLIKEKNWLVREPRNSIGTEKGQR